MIIKLSSPALTFASVLGTVLVAPSTSRQIAKSVNFDKDPADAAPQGFDGGAPRNEGHECSFNESFKVREASDTDVGIFGCDDFEYCAEDVTSSLGGRCINLIVEHEQDFDKTLAVESRRQLAVCTDKNCSTTCTYSDGITTGVKCDGDQACFLLDPDNVECGACIGKHACSFYSWPQYGTPQPFTRGEGSCRGDYSCQIGEYEEV
jgi:hypothetical protein